MKTCCICGAILTGAARERIGTCSSCGADLSRCEHEHRGRTLEPEFMSAEPEAKHGDRAAKSAQADTGVSLRREQPEGPGLTEEEPGVSGPA